MTTRYLFSAELFDIIQRDDGFWFKSVTRQECEGPFDTIAAMSKKMAEHLEESVRHAWQLKFKESPP
jgi:hypothetical protein